MTHKTQLAFKALIMAATLMSSLQGEPTKLEETITSLLNSANSNLNSGIYVESLKDHRVLYKHNKHRYFIPGSTLKIVTTLAALAELGPDYTFKTSAYTGTTPTSSSNVYLEFSGDPTFTTDDLTEIFKHYRKEKGDTLSGNIVIDNRAFGEVPPLNPDWMIGDIHTCEEVFVSGAIIDENHYHCELVPHTQPGKPAKVVSKSGLMPSYPIKNKTITVKPGQGIWRNYGFNYGTMYIEGKVDTPQRIELPAKSFKHFIKERVELALKNAGINFTGKIRWAHVPQGAQLLFNHKSEPLENILIQASHNSHNLTFDAIFLKVATQPNVHTVTNWQDAGNRIKQIIKKHLGVDLEHTIIDDGSGLSRNSLITPAHFSALLLAAYNNPKFGNTFFKTLPTSGLTGTLKNRMVDPSTKGKVHAKTGSLTGVSALVGDIETDSNDLLLFVFLMNDFVGPNTPYTNLQDDLCRLLVKE